MTEDFESRFEHLLSIVGDPPNGGPDASERGLLMVYPPRDELRFRSVFEDYLLRMKTQNVPHSIVDLDTLPFECLHDEGLLEQSYEVEVHEPGDLKRYLADELQKALLGKVREAAEGLGAGAVIVRSPTALFPWVSYAELLAEIPAGFGCYIFIPFPGSESEGKLHFLNQKTGYNYLARRL